MDSGLSKKEVEESRKKYGSNEITKRKKNTFLNLLLESLGDPIIKILLIALAVKVVILFKNFDWFETIGILIAIFLASFISSISEYGSERAFERLSEESKKIKVKVKRDGKPQEILLDEVVKNDIVILNTGDMVPADGYIINGKIYLDESSINGESKETLKTASFFHNPSDNNKVYRGSVVTSGNAYMLTTSVGNDTIYGKLSLELQEDEPPSPLKLRLRDLAKVISKLGYIGAILVTISYLFSKIVIENNFEMSEILRTVTDFNLMFNYLLYALTLSVTIIIVAVPEGLPMMITLVLSSNMKRMLKNNVLVRRLVGIETMGSLNILLTDKTGTLTKGKLEVTSFYTGDLKEIKTVNDIKKNLFYEKVYNSLYYNNESLVNENLEIMGGNTTDRALLKFIKVDLKFNSKVIKRLPFDAANKYAIAKLDKDNLYYIKGASEFLLSKCHKYLSVDNQEKLLFEKDKIENKIKDLTRKGSRVILLAYSKKNIIDEKIDDLVLVGFVCFKDELRPEAKEGIDLIKKAGIDIIMITGDNKDTASLIAKEAGLITSGDDLIINSNELSLMSDLEIRRKLKNIKVISRALPQDKSRLVKICEDAELVVGMTGDGVNDAPALKKASVGIAMGSGTEVAKEAGDIVILDDNILSISNAICYGRTIFKSIRKFIIYQLTCNICALFVSIVGPFIGVDTPITIIQMLWINMIMDTFAGLAFSFEPPLKRYMEEKPKLKNEKVINSYMYKQILFTGLYSAILCVLFLKLPILKNLFRSSKYLMTAYFALFIFIGVVNAFNARTERLNILADIAKNKIFIFIISFIVIVQIYLIYNGGDLFRAYGLTLKELLIVIMLSLSVLVFDLIRKFILKKKGKAYSV